MMEQTDYLDEVIEARRADDPTYQAAKKRHDLVRSLVQLRKDMGLTQQEVADRMGIQRSRLAEIEGDAHSVAFDRLAAFASALGATIELVVPIQPKASKHTIVAESRRKLRGEGERS